MKSFAKLLLVGTVAVMAIAVSAAPSEAAKKKKNTQVASNSVSCKDAGMCATNCGDKTCSVNVCAPGGTWVPAIFTPVCVKAQCPPKC